MKEMTQIPRPPCTAIVDNRINSTTTTIPTNHKHTLKSTPPITTPIQYAFDSVKASVEASLVATSLWVSTLAVCGGGSGGLEFASKQTRSSCYTTPLMMTNPIETTCWVWLWYQVSCKLWPCLSEMRIAKGTVVRAKLGDGHDMDAFKLLYHSARVCMWRGRRRTHWWRD